MDGDDAALLAPRRSVATAIADLQSFSGMAGSEEMAKVQAALQYLGLAYSCLRSELEMSALGYW